MDCSWGAVIFDLNWITWATTAFRWYGVTHPECHQDPSPCFVRGISHHLYEISECSVRKMEIYGGCINCLDCNSHLAMILYIYPLGFAPWIYIYFVQFTLQWRYKLNLAKHPKNKWMQQRHPEQCSPYGISYWHYLSGYFLLSSNIAYGTIHSLERNNVSGQLDYGKRETTLSMINANSREVFKCLNSFREWW
jgi:hypothetical protein